MELIVVFMFLLLKEVDQERNNSRLVELRFELFDTNIYFMGWLVATHSAF